MSQTESSVRTSEREIEISREFEAPPGRVWAAWADAAQIAQWFGPRGFRTVTESREFSAGGEWRYTMIGPDGHEYPNLVTYLEVVPCERLRYTHGGEVEGERVDFEVEVRFEPLGPGDARTRLTMRSIFASERTLRYVVENYGAIEGGKQTQARLAEHLAAGAALDAAVPPFVLVRRFDAPRERIWAAWTEPRHLAAWMGPEGCSTIAAELDLRPGGRLHYGMRTADGVEMWGLCVYREITPPSRLVYVQSFSDAQGGIARHPMAPQWPQYMLTTIQLSEHAGIGRGTTLELRWQPIDATAEEIAVFNGAHAGMNQGWAGSMEKLEAWLANGGPVQAG